MNHANTWEEAISGAATMRRGPSIQRIAFGCARMFALAVNASERLFGAQIIFNGNGDLEASGCVGCAAPVEIMWGSGKPASQGSMLATELTMPSGAFPNVTQCMGFNSGTILCSVVPVSKRTWGQLKSLYR